MKACITQEGADMLSRTRSATCNRSQAATAYAIATRMTLRRFSSSNSLPKYRTPQSHRDCIRKRRLLPGWLPSREAGKALDGDPSIVPRAESHPGDGERHCVAAEGQRESARGARADASDERTLLYLATSEDGSGPWMHALDLLN